MDGAQLELFDSSEVEDLAYRNPMVVLYGKGPPEAKCKTCRFLYRKSFRNHDYIKCEKRGDTNGQGTDHRVGYHSCRWYEQEVG